jgi:long-chain acyl-CoA synthetase
MLGYWRNAEATAETINDGWLHTGDVGHLDQDGFLTITDRKKDLIITSLGKNIAPAEIERLLVSDPYIDQAVVYGDKQPFVTALLVPNFPAMEAKAAELGCLLDVRDGIITSERLHAFIAERIEVVMRVVSQPERVREFLLLARAFQIEEGELTPTMKVRRRYIVDKHLEKLKALYHS